MKTVNVLLAYKEGMFVRFYEQSLFGWQQWVSKQDQFPTLKVLKKKVKKLNGRDVLYGGLPIELLKQAGIDVGTEATTATTATTLLSINSNAKNVVFGICNKDNDLLIGYAGLSSISTLNRSGEYFILIGEKDCWGKGVGTSITKVITDYAMRTLGLHRVELTASVLNQGAIKAYANAGYQHEGVMRQSSFRNGEFIDKVLMSVLSTEWKGI